MVDRANKSLGVLDRCLIDIMHCSSQFSTLKKDDDDVKCLNLKTEATRIKEHADNVIDASKKSKAKCNQFLNMICNKEL